MLLFYQIYGWCFLYKSSVLELSGWAIIVEPLSEAIGNYPVIVGQSKIAFSLLEFKDDELSESISNGEFSIAAILALHLSDPDDQSLLKRTIKFSHLLIRNGFNPSWCEADGKTTYMLLKQIDGLNERIDAFLDNIDSTKDSCIKRNLP